MRTRSLLVILISAVANTPAEAVPTAYYNPATGHIRIVNDIRANALYMKSKSGVQFVTDKSAFAPAPNGVTLDLNDLPLGFTYIDLPPGNYTVGNVVAPNTPTSDLELGFYIFEGPAIPGLVETVPEPASGCLAALALMGLVAARRRLLNSQISAA